MGIRNVYSKIKFYVFRIMYSLRYGNRLEIGKGCSFRTGVYIHITDNGKIVMGENCFFNRYCSICSKAMISIGNHSIFGENVKIYDSNHKFGDINKPISEQGYLTEPIKIGNNCWVGSNVTILKGVTIGNNVIIGANCLITSDIADSVVVRNRSELIQVKRRG